MRVCVHRGKCVRVYMSACVCTDVQKKLKDGTTGQCRIPLCSHIKDTYSLRLSFHIP